MTTYARNLPTEGCPLPEPPPPPPPGLGPLLLEMQAATRADQDAWEVLQAMDADLGTYGPYVHAAWDRAALAGQEARRLRAAYANARRWEGVTVR